MLLKRLTVHFGLDENVKSSRQIAYTEWGRPDNPHIVVCVHGLTRNCRDFDFLAEALEADCRVICVDVVGRGQSDWLVSEAGYDNYLLYLTDAIELLKHISALGSTNIQLDWVGVSMGGLIGMILATQPVFPLTSAVPIRRLVMSDIGPLIPVSALVRIGQYLGRDPRFSSFKEFEAYLKKISNPFGPLTETQWHHLAIHSVREFDDGTYGFRYDPRIAESFKRHLSKDIDLWVEWDKLHVPTLVLRGIESDLLTSKTAIEMKIRGSRTQIIELPGIGHAPMLISEDQIKIVRDFLLAPTLA
ncbi:MAG: alpha/beta hydrolase [Nitrosomonadaceae bacterium]|jgi:pimeloyl-ACP methyl ester carboxylesterase|nr:alpha/beta hydrolase [Nitrosospira sp.]MDW7564544.1 alpha/beta hydrolase [Nitrosomonadaceae bacterium]MBI0410224.1 alpha/beta hydrolase [Nitrosospira sp.]MBI0411415.1 alpha/beta hydrolase [Nitrosospira sp.]MBI0420317.1 alpha/beta hydrolase [Nitrosospira sp.]